MRVVFCKTFFVYNPRVSIILDEMEAHIRKGNEVILLGCDGELRNGCMYNPFKKNIACSSCKYFKKHDLELLSENIKQFSLSDFQKTPENYDFEYETNTISEIYHNGVDIGSACMSSYIEMTRNQKPKITKEFKTFFDDFLNNAAYITDAAEKAFEKLKPDLVYVFNARIHTRRPFFRVARLKNIDTLVVESTAFRGNKETRKIKFLNRVVHDANYICNKINDAWKKAEPVEREKTGNLFYNAKSSGENVDDKSYTKRQKDNLLPDNWDESKHNIVVFNSSDDEFASLGKEWKYYFGKNIFSTLNDFIAEFESQPDYHFYLRIHPNLKNIPYYYHKVLYKLKKYKNLTIIAPESIISSYSLLRAADKVITFGSTIGIEAVYWGKPSILLKLSLYKNLGGNYLPEDFKELTELCKNKKLAPKSVEAALKYGFYRKTHGEEFLYFNPNDTKSFSISFRDKLFFEYVSDYRDKMYKIAFPKLRNFIKYKLYSLPKNIEKFFLKDFPKEENLEAY